MVRDAVPLGECKRALVIRLTDHGDALLASPVIGVLRAHASSMEIDALVYDDTASALEGHPALSRLHTVGRKWRDRSVLERLLLEKALFKDLKERAFDLIVLLSEQPRGAWLARLLGARWSVAPELSGGGRWWRRSFTHLFPVAANRQRVELNLDALRRIGVYPSIEEKAAFAPSAAPETRVRELARTGTA